MPFSHALDELANRSERHRQLVRLIDATMPEPVRIGAINAAGERDVLI